MEAQDRSFHRGRPTPGDHIKNDPGHLRFEARATIDYFCRRHCFSPLEEIELIFHAESSLRGLVKRSATFGSAYPLLSSGVHPKIASERLGHSTIGITLDLYSHVMPGMQANAAEQVDAAIKAAKQTSRE